MKQEVIICTDSRERMFSIIKEHGFRNCLIVAGSAQKRMDFKIPDAKDTRVHIFQPPPGLPETKGIIEAKKKISSLPDCLIAVGGGRVMDIAKFMLHHYYTTGSLDTAPYFITIPTTAGSGSEATPFSVIYEGKEKVSLSRDWLLPQLVLLDHGWLSSLSPYQRAVSGIDALAQAIESLWNRNADPVSSIYAAEAVKILWKELSLFVHDPAPDRDKRVQWAAHLSGKAISITRTTGPHAMSYYLTAHHGIPHGQAVAFFLPLFFLYNEKHRAVQNICSLLGVKNAGEAFEAVRKMITACGLSADFRSMQIRPSIGDLIASVNAERFANNPEPFDAAGLEELILNYLA